MLWFPPIEYILELFRETMEEPKLLNFKGLESTLDKVKWGTPTQPPPTLWDSATILFKDIVEQHFFMDGNKRIGCMLLYFFLKKNGITFTPPVGDIFNMTMEIAKCNVSTDEIKKWVKENSKNSI